MRFCFYWLPKDIQKYLLRRCMYAYIDYQHEHLDKEPAGHRKTKVATEDIRSVLSLFLVSKHVFHLMQNYVFTPYDLFIVPGDRDLSFYLCYEGHKEVWYCGLYHFYDINFDLWCEWVLKRGVDTVIREYYEHCNYMIPELYFCSSIRCEANGKPIYIDRSLQLLQFMYDHCRYRVESHYLGFVREFLYWDNVDALKWLHDKCPILWQKYGISPAIVNSEYSDKQSNCYAYLISLVD